jgi:hypothetical protein
MATWIKPFVPLALALVPLVAPAADLAALRRPPVKEPRYESGSPRYCLLAFGPEAAARVWLVIDGRTLYADRNGDGDLTDPGERKKALTWGGPDGTLFEFGNLTRLGGKKVDLTIRYRAEGADAVGVTLGGEPYQTADHDGEGALHFAARPGQAPIIHIGGPLHFILVGNPAFRRGHGGQILTVRLGSQGLGKGTFALFAHDSLPAELHPVAEIEFPSRAGAGAPLMARVDLTERC